MLTLITCFTILSFICMDRNPIGPGHTAIQWRGVNSSEPVNGCKLSPLKFHCKYLIIISIFQVQNECGTYADYRSVISPYHAFNSITCSNPVCLTLYVLHRFVSIHGMGNIGGQVSKPLLSLNYKRILFQSRSFIHFS